MTWTPRHGHCTQLHADGTGWNDCWQCSLARYLYEAGIVPPDAPYWPTVNDICLASRGYPDSPSNPYTTFDEAERSLRHYGIPVWYSTSYQEVSAQAFSIVYCDGRYLVPDAYPDSWFGGPNPSGNHFVLWLPYWQDSALWLNNPLVPEQVDMQQRIDMFYGAYILPTTGNGESGPVRRKAKQQCGLKPSAAHGGENMLTIPVDGQLIDSGQRSVTDDTWAYIQYTDRYGYIPAAYIVDL